MELTTGLFENMVLQRTCLGVCDVGVGGVCGCDGDLVASVAAESGDIGEFADSVIGAAAAGAFQGRLHGIPAGGPYCVEIAVRRNGKTLDSAVVRNVMVGDVWLLAGQSNMQGYGLLENAMEGHAWVRAFYMDDRWDIARDPIHNLYAAVDDVHGGIPGAPMPPDLVAGTGPGVAFAKDMLRLTGVPQGLIACAHGGTTMEQWDPAAGKQGSQSLYGAMLRRFRKNGSRVAGLAWYQGESDAHEQGCPRYSERMTALIACVREDCGDAQLPVVMVQLGRVTNWAPSGAVWWNSIQEQQRGLPDQIERLAVVPAVDLGLDDCIHISGRDQQRLGRRLAQAMEALRGNGMAGQPPITVESVRSAPTRRPDVGTVDVVFGNVVGALNGGRRPGGFTVTDVDGNDRHVYAVELKGNRAVLYTTLPPDALKACSVSYGKGNDPACIVVDSADRSLPVFGPLCPTGCQPRVKPCP